MLAEWGNAALGKLGYRVTSLTDSAEALRVFRTDPSLFDLVVTDQAMPHMAGLELSAELLKVRPGVPIILVTGHSETVSPETAQKSGIKAFLMKPFGRQALAQAVRRALDSHKCAPAR